MIDREKRLWDALKRITNYDEPERIRKHSEKLYGLEPDEAIEMAYDAVRQVAKDAIKGTRRPK